MERIKLNWSKIGIFTIQAIGCFLTILVACSLALSQKLFPMFCFVCLSLGTQAIILHILTKTQPEDSPYFDPQYAWKYRMLPWIFICLIILCFYWIEALAVLIFWAGKIKLQFIDIYSYFAGLIQIFGE